MEYFNNLQTIEEVKREYKNLIRGAATDQEAMKINKDFDFICAKMIKSKNQTAQETSAEISITDQFKEKINAIINIEGIKIEITGLWIWVTGETRSNKDVLKSSGYFWASKKEAWFWRPASAAGGRGKHTLDEIRNKYGSTVVNNSNYKQQARITA